MVLETASSIPTPDTGYAWVVAMACFFINFLMAGLARSAGVIYVALIDAYGISREVATAPFSIRVSVRNLSGPLVGMLGQKYGIRFVTSIGGLVAALGSIFCYFAPDIFWITMFWGGVHGIGFGLCTVLHMITINKHFDKYRATALGLAYCGDSIGTFVLPVLIDALFDEYGVAGAFLMIGGVVLNVIPLALLLRSPTWMNTSPASNKVNGAIANTEEQTVPDHPCDKGAINEPQSTSFNSLNTINLGEKLTSNMFSNYTEVLNASTQLVDDASKRNEGSYVDIKDSASKCENIFETYEATCNNYIHENVDSMISTNLQDDLQTNEINECLSAVYFSTDGEESSEMNDIVHSEIQNVSVLKKADGVTEIVMESRDLNCGNMVKTTITDEYDNDSNILRIRTLSESHSINLKVAESTRCSFHEHGTTHGNENKTNAETSTSDTCQEVKFRKGNVEVIQNPVCSSIIISCNNNSDSQEIDLKHNSRIHGKNITSTGDEQVTGLSNVLRSALKANLKPIFILISATMAVYGLLFIAVLTVIVDFGVDKGIPQEKGKYLIIAFSATDLIGRLCFGIVIDRKWIAMKHYAVITVGAMGFSVCILPLGSEYLTMLVGMSFFGLAQSGSAIMFPILIAKYMTKNEESIAMGSLSFYGGLLLLGLAPLIGFFRDHYGSYDRMFYLVGFSSIAVGLLWSLEPVLLKLQNRQREKQ